MSKPSLFTQAKKILRELAIVVVGILIAFALNNWAQTAKDRKIQNNYLEGLAEDLKADRLLLQGNLDSLTALEKKARQMLQHIFAPNPLPGRADVASKAWAELTQAPTFVSNQSTYQTMLNSGDLKYIEDFDLKNKIVNHYKRYENLENENYRSQVFMENIVIPYFMQETDFIKVFNKDTEEYWKDQRFRNILLSYTGIFHIQIQAYREALKRCDTLLEQLDEVK